MTAETNASQTLVVLLHGYAHAAAAVMGEVRRATEAIFPGATLLVPELAYGKVFSRTSPADIAAGVVDEIDRLWNGGGKTGFQRIVILGFSAGAVIARKVIILAHGAFDEAPFEPELQRFAKRRDWSERIDRFVLLAGVTRGWAVSSAMNPWTRGFFAFGEFLNLVTMLGRGTIFALQRGTPFMVQTRLQWLALMRSCEELTHRLTVVQLLGTIDDLVSPDDSIDTAIDVIRTGSYYFLEIPQTAHLTSIYVDPDLAKTAADRHIREGRLRCLRLALAGSREELERERIPPSQMADTESPEPDPAVKNVVFVVHGIRDRGFWTQKVARVIKREAARSGPQGTSEFRSVTASYGYFAMAPFLFPWLRRQKVAWLMDQYAETRARYPNAKFHYVGHSNGTYLAARALVDYPAARFERIVFAGSVIRRDYDWHRFLQTAEVVGGAEATVLAEPRVKEIMNYVASGDWVVALFPKGLQPFRIIDLGSAGHDGFAPHPKIAEVRYIRGSHGAGVRESQWDDIAAFIVHGKRPDQRSWDDNEFAPKQSWLWSIAGRWSTVILAVIVCAALLVFYWIASPLMSPLTPAVALLNLLGLALYLWALWVVLTRI